MDVQRGKRQGRGGGCAEGSWGGLAPACHSDGGVHTADAMPPSPPPQCSSSGGVSWLPIARHCGACSSAAVGIKWLPVPRGSLRLVCHRCRGLPVKLSERFGSPSPASGRTGRARSSGGRHAVADARAGFGGRGAGVRAREAKQRRRGREEGTPDGCSVSCWCARPSPADKLPTPWPAPAAPPRPRRSLCQNSGRTHARVRSPSARRERPPRPRRGRGRWVAGRRPPAAAAAGGTCRSRTDQNGSLRPILRNTVAPPLRQASIS